MATINKKIVIPAVLGITAALIGMAILLPSSAVAQQLTTPTTPSYDNNFATTNTAVQRPNITGSINVPRIIENNIKVSFSQAADTAAKQVSGGMVTGGHLGVVQGYLVYRFTVVDSSNQTAYKVLVDPGNGQVLYKSAGHPMFFGYHHNHCEFDRGSMMMQKQYFGGMTIQNQTGTSSNTTTASTPLMALET